MRLSVPGAGSGNEKLMQNRNGKKGRKKIFRPTSPDIIRHNPTSPDMKRPTRPTMSEFVQLSYNARKQLNGPASATAALTAAHHINRMNCTQTTRKRS